MSLRAFARQARRAAGLMTRTVDVVHFNRLTGIRETRKATHRLSATGFIRGAENRIESVRQPNPSKPGPGWRAEQRRNGGGKVARRRTNGSRAWGRRFEAAAQKGVMP